MGGVVLGPNQAVAHYGGAGVDAEDNFFFAHFILCWESKSSQNLKKMLPLYQNKTGIQVYD
jgi:hypothetical protein